MQYFGNHSRKAALKITTITKLTNITTIRTVYAGKRWSRVSDGPTVQHNKSISLSTYFSWSTSSSGYSYS